MTDPKSPVPEGHSESPSFESLLRLLDQDRDRAGEKYEQLRRKLIKFFEWNFCFLAEDLADETFKKLEQKIGQEEIRDIAGFAWGVARNVRQQARKEVRRMVAIADVPGGEGAWPDPQDSGKAIEDQMQADRRYKCLQLCLQRLPGSNRELFLAYHNVTGESLLYRQELAKRLGLTLGALRVRVNRLRNQLEKCARQCLGSWQIDSRRIT
jgi:RNA polymerase sigma factor (sigma-70 family)